MTAVEWLVEQMKDDRFLEAFEDEFKQAKEMEKEQIKKSFSDGSQWELYGSDLTHQERAEQYYNETYKK
jgi:hypothetical protein